MTGTDPGCLSPAAATEVPCAGKSDSEHTGTSSITIQLCEAR